MQKEIKVLNLQLGQQKKKTDLLSSKYFGLQGKYQQEKQKYDNFISNIEEKAQKIEVKEEINNQNINQRLNAALLKSFDENKKQYPNNYSYSQEVYDVSHLLHNICPKSYEILRKIFILPSEKSISDKYDEEENELLEGIQKVENMPRIIEKYRQFYNLNEVFECILSIDAAGLDRPNKKSKSYVFLFDLQPLNPLLKCIPIHIYAKENGNSNDAIINIINHIIEQLKLLGIIIKIVATDGDTGYNKKSYETFSKYISIFEKDGFLATIENIIYSDEVFWISDFLHILKLARKRLIQCSITVKNSVEHVFSNKTIEAVLKLGSVLTDESGNGFMKDFYPLKLFSFENLNILLESQLYDEYLYFLPFCLWTEAILSNNLTKKTRLYFLRIAFQILYCFYHQVTNVKFMKGITIRKTKNSIAQFFNNQIFIIRCLNTLLITYSLILKQDSIKLSRIGSHPLENFFGHIRILCKNFDSFENFLRCTIKTFSNMSITQKYNIQSDIKNRLNVAGAHIDDKTGWFNIDDELCSNLNVVIGSFYDTLQDFTYIFPITPDEDSYRCFQKELYDYTNNSERFTDQIYKPKFSSGTMAMSRCKSAQMAQKINE